jgi:putative DNA primase/helicase
MWRRMRLIPFLQRFEGEQKDPRLLEKLKAEASGILNWAIEGCLAWQREGLEPPKSVQEATREYQQASDTLGLFLDECCEVGADLLVLSAALWEAYEDWCRENGEKPLTRRVFQDRLKSRGFRSGKKGHKKNRVWQGLRLASQVPCGELRVVAGADYQNSSNNIAKEKL